MRDTRLLPALTSRRSARALALATGLFRSAAGPALLARPETLARLLGVDSITARRTEWITRLLAGRETALGLGTLHAALTGRPVRPWLLAQAASDATDAAALLLAVRSGQVSTARALAVTAFASAGTLGELLASLERPRPTG